MVGRMTIAGSCFWEKDFCIPSRTEAGHAILDGILLQLQDYEWPQKDIFAIQLAFEEALVNAIRHGNQSENRLGVKVHLEISPQVFLARISDEGTGFDPDNLPDPTLDDFLERPCGRGVKLMRSFMTSVDFNERGNVVTMKKERSAPSQEHRENQDAQTASSGNFTVSDLPAPQTECVGIAAAGEEILPKETFGSVEMVSAPEVFTLTETVPSSDTALEVHSESSAEISIENSVCPETVPEVSESSELTVSSDALAATELNAVSPAADSPEKVPFSSESVPRDENEGPAVQ